MRYVKVLVQCLSMWVMGCGLAGGSKAMAQMPEVFTPLTWEQASSMAAREGKLVLAEVGFRPGEGEIGGWSNRKGGAAGSAYREIMNYLARQVIGIRIEANTPQARAFTSRLLLYEPPLYAFFMPYGDLVGVVFPGEAENRPERLREVLDEAKALALEKKRNSRSVRFAEGTLKEALAVAGEEGRQVFVFLADRERQASLLMEQDVLTLNRVADFYNRHFINIRLSDAEARELAGRYGMEEAPAYLYLTAEGKVLGKERGLCSAEVLVEYGQRALEKSKGIAFATLTDAEASARARREGKYIFIDYHTPGRAHDELAEQAFRDPEVTDFFATHFVCVAREGDAAALVFTDGEGRELHRLGTGMDSGRESGVKSAEELLTEAKKVLAGRGVEGLAARYRQGERGEELVLAYVEALARAGRRQEASAVAMEHLAPLSPEVLRDKRHWAFFNQYCLLAERVFFDYLLAHRTELYALHGKEAVERKVAALWTAGADAFIREGVFDEEGFKAYAKRLKKEKVPGWQGIVRNARMHAAEQVEDWKTFVTLAEEKWHEEEIGDAELYRWAQTINTRCGDSNVRYKMAQWLAQRAMEISRKERLTGKVDLTSYRGFFEKMANDLLK